MTNSYYFQSVQYEFLKRSGTQVLKTEQNNPHNLHILLELMPD